MGKDIKNKTLFLWLNESEFHAKQASKRGVETKKIFKNTPSFLKLIRRFFLKLPYISIGFWLNQAWVKQLEKFETVIIHASLLTPKVVRFIANKNPQIRIIVWYWNPIVKSVAIKKFEKRLCEIWTFDEDDSERYSIRHNTQYYFRDIYDGNTNKLKHGNLTVFFVGGDKGRLDYLLDIKEKLIQNKIEPDFNITNTSKVKVNSYVYQPRINYERVIERISASSAILDVVADKQTGLTLRPLEAMYFKKKLITNDKTIVNRDFYKKENIHVLGLDDFSKIKEFISSPYLELSEAIVARYDFDFWLSRFYDA